MSQYKQYYTVYKDKDWEILPQIHQGVMKSCNFLKRFLKEEKIVRCSNGWNPLSSRPQIKRIKDWHIKKREASKEEAPVASTRELQANQYPRERNKKEKELEETGFPMLQDSKNLKNVMENFFNIAGTLMEFKDTKEQRMRETHFQKK
ncbi:hypothetical protein O181_046158 [Austropuccinia psidii MF-1]|uniref:Uncharacterized protein n=1 Tax=Austropuccinia psidii MF-1 TaxID=1389203 RepID=A0A9Q3DTG8_9BASI|nr:hypothetical protein [Austropuccinia psidii MF-1]